MESGGEPPPPSDRGGGGLTWSGLASGARRLRSSKRALLLGNFLATQVVLILADVVTDIVGGLALLSRGHSYWGAVTLALPFAPFCGVCAACAFSAYTRWRRTGAGPAGPEPWSLFRHLPFIQPMA